MKIGDLVRCPVDLKTGEMFSGEHCYAIIIEIFKNEPKIQVAYISEVDGSWPRGVWFTEELELINES